MFPIWNGQGAVIGYTSRALKDDQQPKYLNSSESFIYASWAVFIFKPKFRKIYFNHRGPLHGRLCVVRSNLSS